MIVSAAFAGKKTVSVVLHRNDGALLMISNINPSARPEN
jgi:hypothetical protein